MKPVTASSATLEIVDLPDFKHKLLHWAAGFDSCVFLDSNEYEGTPYSQFECLVAAGIRVEISADHNDPFRALQELIDQGDWVFGHFGYDLKNQLENLASNNPDHLGFEEMYFFIPEHVVHIQGTTATIISDSPDKTEGAILGQTTDHDPGTNLPDFRARMSREEYLQKVHFFTKCRIGLLKDLFVECYLTKRKEAKQHLKK